MTTDTTETIDLKKKYTAEERDEMFYAYVAALHADDQKTADALLEIMPIHPRWAKIIAEVNGKEYLVRNFNITYADEVFGEGWLDEL